MRFLLPLITVLSLSSCVFVMNNQERASEQRDFTFPAADIQTLRVETYNGSIVIADGTESVVECSAEFYARASTEADAAAHLPEMTVAASRDGDTLLIRVPPHSKLGTNNNGAKLRLTVPAGIKVDLYSSNGSVETLSGFHEPRIRTSNGNVTVRTLSGPVNVRASNGRIVVEDWSAPDEVELTTSNGSVHYSGGSLNFEVRTSNGSIKLNLPDGWEGTGVAHTSNSNVTIQSVGLINAELSARTSNGSMQVSGPKMEGSGTIRVETSNGNVRVEHGGQ